MQWKFKLEAQATKNCNYIYYGAKFNITKKNKAAVGIFRDLVNQPKC